MSALIPIFTFLCLMAKVVLREIKLCNNRSTAMPNEAYTPQPHKHRMSVGRLVLRCRHCTVIRPLTQPATGQPALVMRQIDATVASVHSSEAEQTYHFKAAGDICKKYVTKWHKRYLKYWPNSTLYFWWLTAKLSLNILFSPCIELYPIWPRVLISE